MSGSGGFYKYRCKNFYSHNCPNWVWVNNSPCATCIAEGRDAEEQLMSSTMVSHGIVALRTRDDILHHAITEPMAPNDSGESWISDDKGNGFAGDDQSPQEMPMTSLILPCSYRTIAGWQ
ncbi:hypothetical protein CCMA1212_008788 [Trichoderma ghanense]|uniref:Uncharacterized protein n=1 Tax=Trichoderma ghanense TaxID=65468 RepID=A0ABY2GU25_9HYPO